MVLLLRMAYGWSVLFAIHFRRKAFCKIYSLDLKWCRAFVQTTILRAQVVIFRMKKSAKFFQIIIQIDQDRAEVLAHVNSS
jgi:hypothetical protein